MVSQKGKSRVVVESLTLPPVIKLDELPLIDTQLKITETQCGFDLYELHNWEYQKFEDANDELCLWESMLPQYSHRRPPKPITSLNSSPSAKDAIYLVKET